MVKEMEKKKKEKREDIEASMFFPFFFFGLLSFFYIANGIRERICMTEGH